MRNSNKRLLCYSKILKEKLVDTGCTFIIQKISDFGIIQEYHRNSIDSKIIEHVVNNIRCLHRMEVGKDIIKIYLFQE